MMLSLDDDPADYEAANESENEQEEDDGAVGEERCNGTLTRTRSSFMDLVISAMLGRARG